MCNEKKMEYNEMTNDRLQISITVSIYKKKKKTIVACKMSVLVRNNTENGRPICWRDEIVFVLKG